MGPSANLVRSIIDIRDSNSRASWPSFGRNRTDVTQPRHSSPRQISRINSGDTNALGVALCFSQYASSRAVTSLRSKGKGGSQSDILPTFVTPSKSGTNPGSAAGPDSSMILATVSCRDSVEYEPSRFVTNVDTSRTSPTFASRSSAAHVFRTMSPGAIRSAGSERAVKCGRVFSPAITA